MLWSQLPTVKRGWWHPFLTGGRAELLGSTVKHSAPCVTCAENSTAVITNHSTTFSPLPPALAPLLPVGEQGRVQVRGGAGEGRLTHWAGPHGLRGRARGCPREAWPLPQAGSPGCGGLREPSARLSNVGSKNSWIHYPSCVLAVPSRCQGKVLAAPAAPDSSYSSTCLLGCKAFFGWVRCFPGSPPNTAWQGLSLTSYPARAEVVPQPEERFGAKSNTGHKEVAKHRRHVALARGESTTVFHKALGCYRDRQTHHTEGADRTAAAGDTGSLLHRPTGRPDYCVIPGGPNSIRDPAV